MKNKLSLKLLIFVPFLLSSFKCCNKKTKIMSESNNVIHVTNQNFENEVINSDKPVIVDFFATWCGPCQKMSVTLEELSKEKPEIKFVKINVDEEPELATKFRIMSLPTLVAFEKGEEINRVVGHVSKATIIGLINKN